MSLCRKIKARILLISCNGASIVEIKDERKQTISKGKYVDNLIGEVENLFDYGEKCTKVYHEDQYNFPCKNGEWYVYNFKKKLLRIETWSCNVLVKTVQIDSIHSFR